MSTRKNPETSLDAYKSLEPKQLQDIYKKILAALKVLGSASTEQIAKYLTFEHAKIHKRISEMERLELVYKPGNKVFTKSGRQAFVWAIRGTENKEEAVEVKPKREVNYPVTNRGNYVEQQLF